MYIEDNKGGQKKLTTLKESIFKEHNVRMVRKDLTEGDERSITDSEQDGGFIVAGRNDPDITIKD